MSAIVSIVIPCYNHGEYLSECCDSVLAQTFQDFEIIIVNDGSTDEKTIEILRDFSKPKTKIINTINQGLAAARNAGISAASGEYILPLDADDRIGKDYLGQAVELLDREPELGIVYCRAEYFGAKNGEWKLAHYSFPRFLRNNVIFCSAVFRKSDWELCGGYRRDMIFGMEDYDLWLSIIKLPREVRRLDEILFFYHQHDKPSMIHKMNGDEEKKLAMRLKIIEHHIDLYSAHPEYIVPFLLNRELKTPFTRMLKLLSSLIPVRSLRKKFRASFLD